MSAVRTISSRLVSGALSKMSPVPGLVPVPGWRFGDPEHPGAGMKWRFRVYKALRFSELEVTVRANWHRGTSVEVTLPSDFGRCLWVAGCFEPNETAFLASVLRPGMTFIDIGANIGLYTLLAAHLVAPGDTVVAVEPSPREQVSLRRNLAVNGQLAVRVRTEALGRADGTATLHVTDASHSGQNTLGAPVYARTKVIDEIEVRVTTFDRLVNEEGLERIDVVKIDVEGAEELVLQGGEASLRRFRPLVLLELQDPSLRTLGSSAERVIALLESLDYSVVGYSARTGRPERGPLHDGQETDSPNVVACPNERVDEFT
ncbi:MAG: FkbM family methyltransferase [Acidimicrobiales bacterium]